MSRKAATLLVLLGVLIGCATTQLAPRVAEAQVAAAAPAADAVEYRLLMTGSDLHEETLQQLQALGAQGWRVVATTADHSGETRNMVLMRTKR